MKFLYDLEHLSFLIEKTRDSNHKKFIGEFYPDFVQNIYKFWSIPTHF